jgi:hypothetical protein
LRRDRIPASALHLLLKFQVFLWQAVAPADAIQWVARIAFLISQQLAQRPIFADLFPNLNLVALPPASAVLSRSHLHTLACSLSIALTKLAQRRLIGINLRKFIPAVIAEFVDLCRLLLRFLRLSLDSYLPAQLSIKSYR